MIKAIIIDDEVHCIDTLSILLAHYCPEVEVIDKFRRKNMGGKLKKRNTIPRWMQFLFSSESEN